MGGVFDASDVVNNDWDKAILIQLLKLRLRGDDLAHAIRRCEHLDPANGVHRIMLVKRNGYAKQASIVAKALA